MKKLLTILLLLLVLIGCSQSNDSFTPQTPAQEETAAPDVDVDYELIRDYLNDEPSNSVFDPTKIVQSGTFNIESRDYDKDKTSLESLLTSHEGFTERSSVTGHPDPDNPYSFRELRLTLRIPSDNFDEFVSQLNEQFTIVHQSTQARSVADSYYNSENRIEVLETQQTRLLELLENAQDLTDIFLLQEQLMEVEYELNSHKSNLQKLDDQIDYSTIQLTMSELSDSQSSLQSSSFLDELSRAFSRGIHSIILAGQNFILFLAENVVWLVLLIILGIVLYRFVRTPKEKPKSE